MFDKFFLWLGANRKPIGYTFGYVNLGFGMIYLLLGEIGLALMWTVTGGFILFNTWEEQ